MDSGFDAHIVSQIFVNDLLENLTSNCVLLFQMKFVRQMKMNLLTKQDAILWKFDDITNPPANFIQIPI
jgi:hypothetical protein